METKGKFPFKIKDNILIGEKLYIEKDINIGEIILNTLKSQPNFVAQVDALTGKEITFQEIRKKSVQLALWMQLVNVRPGDVIGISSNHHAVMYVFLACLYIGAIPTLWYEKHKFATALKIIFDDNRKMIFIDDVLANAYYDDIKRKLRALKVIVFGMFGTYQEYDILESKLDASYNQKVIDNFTCKPLDKNRENIAAILYTRGSNDVTINSVKISHSIFMAAVNQQVFDMLPDGVGMWVGSFSSLTNMIFAVCSILRCKQTIRLIRYWKRGICQTIEKYKIKWVLLETDMCRQIIKTNLLKRYDFSSLKMLIFNGSPISYYDHQNLVSSLRNASVISLYGTTETGIISCQTENGKFRSSGYVGKNICLKITDLHYGHALGPNKHGEIFCICEDLKYKVYNIDGKYQKMIEIYGWYRTGDIGYYDENGEIFITERMIDFIFYKEFWYSPTIIENIISRCSDIDEVAVVGITHMNDGDHPIAFVTPKPGKRINLRQIIKDIKNLLDDHMQLRGGVVMLLDMPYKFDGTINRFKLRQVALYYKTIITLKLNVDYISE